MRSSTLAILVLFFGIFMFIVCSKDKPIDYKYKLTENYMYGNTYCVTSEIEIDGSCATFMAHEIDNFDKIKEYKICGSFTITKVDK